MKKVVIRCHRINKRLQEDGLDENKYGNRLDEMMMRCDNQDEKVTVKVISSLQYTVLNNSSKKRTRIKVDIETLRPSF